MNRTFYLSNLLIGIFICSVTFAEQNSQKVIHLSSSLALIETEPDVKIKTELVWSSLGYQVNWKILPAERSLRTAVAGDVDGEAGRVHYDSVNFTSLIRIPVAITKLDIWVVIPKDKPCFAIEELPKKRPVGMVGFRYFNYFYELSEVGYEESRTPVIGAKMLHTDRADYSAASLQGLEYIKKETGLEFKTCYDQPAFTLNRYPYLHIKHREIVNAVTQAYEKEFGPRDP